MNTNKNLFILTVLFSFIVSIFGSFLVFNYLSTKDSNIPVDIVNNMNGQNNEPKKIVNLSDLQGNVKEIVKNLNTSVVNIVISKDIQTYRSDPYGFFYQPSGTVKQKVGGGSGFFVTKNGLVLTNKHVVSDPNASYTIITSSNEEFEGKILALDPSNDLAILKAYKVGKEITINNPVSLINDTKSIEVGDFIIAIGNALAEFQNTTTFGMVSGLGRTIQAGDQMSGSSEQLSGLIQLDAAINPGNSGGPLVNLSGQVIGINTAIAAGANGLGFAIPMSQKEVDYMIKSIEKYGKIVRPYIGIKYFPLDKNIAKNLNLKSEVGDYISSEPGSILKDGPAYKAGLMGGDIILEADSIKLGNGITIKNIIKNKFPGDKIKLKILRGDEEKYIDLILG
ncbi:trypsin-like peptidase domain-containing protein [Candidatus Gracilibacteria bacterium]|nr:trypsin-like peptidase domain-containing protein [Candidatus Gracilibacteria bacterium]